MVHGITKHQISKMNNGNDCLKETAVPIESVFSIESSEDKALPIMIQLKHLKLLR